MGSARLKNPKPTLSQCVFVGDTVISRELGQHATGTNLGLTGPRVDRLQVGPTGLAGGQCSVAELNADIDLMLISQGYSDIYGTGSIHSRHKPQPHRAESEEATSEANSPYRCMRSSLLCML